MTEPGLEVGNVDCQDRLSLYLPSDMNLGALTFSSHALTYAAV